MRHDLMLYWRLLGVQLRSQMQYRASFLIDLISTGWITMFEFGSLALVLQRFGNFEGWTVAEVAFLYGMVEIAFSIMDMTFDAFDPRKFGLNVRKGTFDQLLLRPINITLQVLGSSLELRRVGRLVMGIVILSFALRNVTVVWTVAKIAYFPFVIGGMVCFFGGLFIIGATITFWTVESIEVMNILTYGSSQAITYPISIFQRWLRNFLTFILPVAFLNYYPSLWLLGKSDPYGSPVWAPFLSPLVGGAVLFVALRFWRFGIRHYKSSGS